MPQVSPQQGTAACRVLTFKEGLLSAVAHDLELAVGRFFISWDEPASKVDGRFDAASLKVVLPGSLSEADRAQIEFTLKEAILQADRYPQIRFAGSQVRKDPGGYQVDGTLDLRGVRQPLTAFVRDRNDRLECEVEIDQRQFGITPYRAALGTLRVKPMVRVVLTVTPTAPAPLR
jgi:polyisoprenoid-binding protein YceI